MATLSHAAFNSPEKTKTKKSSIFESPEPTRRRPLGGSFAASARASPLTPGSKKKESRPNLLLSRSTAKERQSRLSKALHAEDLIDTAVAFVSKTEEAEQAALLKSLYSLIRKKTGALGGGGSGGAIYGEITQESFQKVVECLKDKTGFGPNSVFIDIGAGLGKPNFHVTINPGVKLSLGVEVIGGRWWQSICLLDHCLSHKTLQSYAQRVFFAHADVQDMPTFDPITHVYSFNRGFPPEAMRAVASAFHASTTAEFFICFDKPNVLEGHGFDIELVDFVPTKMAGSGEQHRCYIYRRNDLHKLEVTQQAATRSSGWGTPVSKALFTSRDASPVRSPSRSLRPPSSPIKTPKRYARDQNNLEDKTTHQAKKQPVKVRTPVRTRSRAAKQNASVPAKKTEQPEKVAAPQPLKASVRRVAKAARANRGRNDDARVEKSSPKKSVMNEKLGWRLVAPPRQVEFAPHVPHATNYLRGLAAMVSNVDQYKGWVRDQIGLDRCDRVSRSSRRAACQQQSWSP
mmetsp:Transcript_17300/g.31766  ORF Transcript_17300/g.31766 Transcript_17300/m.31766 type:complete len:516 (-) Transcript_17300:178-1725(-)|eukprot:CAMPEP_0184550186 /NCGR_PEP_ID=MMETSP0199_2-20130426/18005_1 /TAXON_ID=1112570 /ORGANISM="Thraustochytrium sp., Strain LLF1b" /LENGTH=515 /DNA_ID=CAMNT_0026945007 /DNA_START=403 /DNA_END=1950 /DNA_ORIENTATION=+